MPGPRLRQKVAAEPKAMHQFANSFPPSFDGSRVAITRGHTDSDVVLLEESKP
jgi:hypothetical protein